ncbi:hypothetical protein [Bradyrhizobium sp. 930_D9_N1_4]|uniref:hypothetical protein n=1 Tax=Bradyrhizobium sp. 930_D9_N1_4 TaxID=3240374 RepID=UPI003F88E42E
MKKLAYVVAAIGALAVAVPTLASAQTVVIKNGHHHGYGARAEMRGHRDHGWHRGWHGRDRVVVVKRGHRHHHWD